MNCPTLDQAFQAQRDTRGSTEARQGLYGDLAWVRGSLQSLRDLESCGARFHIRGLDRLGAERGPLVFVSNHMSTLETFVLPGLICPVMPVTFVVKQSLVEHPFFGPIRRSRPVHIEFGEPLDVHGNGREQHAEVIRIITDRLIRWGGMAR